MLPGVNWLSYVGNSAVCCLEVFEDFEIRISFLPNGPLLSPSEGPVSGLARLC